MNWKGYGRNYPGICLQGRLRKTTKSFSYDSLTLGRYLTPEPSKYEAGVPTTEPLHSVFRSKLKLNEEEYIISYGLDVF
jgi:hypothetical protein